MNKQHQEIIEKIRAFLKMSEGDHHHSNHSWDHCYGFFKEYRRLSCEKRSDQMKLACLHLGFYLASWGMFRGRAFLSSKDYRIYEHVIPVLLKPEYDDLWSIDFQTAEPSQREAAVKKVFCLKAEIADAFTNNITMINGEARQPSITGTLVSKILLGTMGCAPAYDRYFQKGLKKEGLRPYSSFSEKSFREVVRFTCEAFPSLQCIRKEIGIPEYSPIMKAVDMYFWKTGEADVTN